MKVNTTIKGKVLRALVVQLILVQMIECENQPPMITEKTQCFYKSNNRCSTNHKLDITIQFLCSFVERSHPNDIKCLVSGVPVNCYDCLTRNTILSMHKRFNTYADVEEEPQQTITNLKEHKGNMIIIVISLISLVFCIVFIHLVRTGKTGGY